MTGLTPLRAALDALEPIEGGWRGAIPEGWLQNRTAYGGFSAALALHAAKLSDADLPPLRSAQVSFVGPLSGPVTITAHRLRRGRNAAFVQADVESGAGLGLRAIFVFMSAIESRIDHATGEAPDFPIPGPAARTFFGMPAVAFSQNFEMLDRRGEHAAQAEWLRWARLREREGLDPEIELIAVADFLPPVALKLLGEFAPVSSMTWLLNLLGPAPRSRDGWFLLRATSPYARGGFSSQDMAIWDADGRPVAAHMQSVAVFT